MEPFYNLPFIKLANNKKELKDKNVLKFKTNLEAIHNNEFILFTEILNLKKYNYASSFVVNIKNNLTDIENFCTENKIELIVSNISRKSYHRAHDVVGIKFLCEKQKLIFQLKYGNTLVNIA